MLGVERMNKYGEAQGRSWKREIKCRRKRKQRKLRKSGQ